MQSFKTRAVWLLAVAASAASAIGGYQSFYAAPKSAPANTVEVEAASPSAAVKTGSLAYISRALRHELESLPTGAKAGVFAHFTPDTIERRMEILRRFSLTTGTDFYPEADAVFVQGTAETIMALAAEPGVYYIEQNEKLEYFNHTGNWAIRTRVAQERVGLGPYYDALGRVLDGTGIGVAVVDSGLDGTHGDFDEALDGGRNYRNACVFANTAEASCTNAQFVDVGATGTSDTSSGHGQHVAGTVLGNGFNSTASYPDPAGTPFIKGSFAGVAPKAKLYAYNTGEAISVLSSTQAFQHIARNYDDRTIFPTPIRVVNNSYGNAAGTAYAPNSVFSQLVRQVVAKGAVVAFAAGNSGDATANDTTSGQCKDPTPGVICVGGHFDGGSGDRESRLYDSTSQGPLATPANYPDIVAPGEAITSTCSAQLPLCKLGDTSRTYFPFYGTISGTSMATPHAAGAIALLLQAKPGLTPAQVEDVLQDNALKVVDNVYGAARAAYVSDPQNAGGTTNYRAGAGLLDLPATLDALGVAKFGSLPDNVETTLISGDANAAGGADNGSQTAVGASDFVKLTAQHEDLGGTTGIRWRLTVANAAALGGASAVTYRIIGNFNGKPRSTGGTLSAAGFVGDGLGATVTAAATNVSKSGNVLSLFVPLTALGSPPVGAPIHNLRVVVTSDADGDPAEVDYAPSRMAMPTDNSSSAPAWGKPYTVLLAAAGSGNAPAQNRCEVPGITLLTDASGDSITDANQDLLSASVAQPFAASGNPNLVFTIQVASLMTLNPGSAYFMSFNTPTFGVMGVRMQVANPTAPTYITYTAAEDNDGETDGTFVATPSPAEAGSTYDAATGIITIIARPSAFGLATGQSLTGFNSGVSQNTDPGNVGVGFSLAPDQMPDGLSRTGAFEYKANAFCAPNTPPVAVLSAAPGSGAKPLVVNFSGANSTETDAGDSIVEYVFDFGDGSAFKTQATPTITHTYTRGGVYQAALKVKDSRGAESALGMTTVTVNNTRPVAVLDSDKSTGTAPLTVAFDAMASSDPNEGDSVVSYSFDLDGDGTFEMADGDSAKPSFTYQQPGDYTAKVKVKDNEGLESEVASKVIAVKAATPVNTAPTARLAADKTTGDAPLTVTFDASTSSDADADDAVASYSFDLDGDGTFEIVDSANAKPGKTYSTPGSFTAKVKVKDKAGLESAVATLTITVKAANTAPTARLAADKTSGEAPLAVAFDASTSSDADADDAVASYSFDLDGDGTFEIVDSASAKPGKTYTTSGSFTAKVKVKDKAGLESATASVTITVSNPPPPNTAPSARLAADKTQGEAPLAVVFDASASSDAEDGSALAYSFDYGTGAGFTSYGSNARPGFSYSAAGSYDARVKVRDSAGAEAISSAVRITVTAPPVNTRPVAALAADRTSGEAPLTVTFDASASRDNDAGDAVASYSFDLDGDGTFEITASPNAKPAFTYDAAGSYTARVKVKDKAGAESEVVSVTITVSNPPPPEPVQGGSVSGQSASNGGAPEMRAGTLTRVGEISFTNRSGKVHHLNSITLTLDAPQKIGTLRAASGTVTFTCPATPAAVNVCTADARIEVPPGGTVKIDVHAAQDRIAKSVVAAKSLDQPTELRSLQLAGLGTAGGGLWLLGTLGFARPRSRRQWLAATLAVLVLAGCQNDDRPAQPTVLVSPSAPAPPVKTVVTVKLGDMDMRDPAEAKVDYSLPPEGVEVGKVTATD